MASKVAATLARFPLKTQAPQRQKAFPSGEGGCPRGYKYDRFAKSSCGVATRGQTDEVRADGFPPARKRLQPVTLTVYMNITQCKDPSLRSG